jgi:hypothetical protein
MDFNASQAPLLPPGVGKFDYLCFHDCSTAEFNEQLMLTFRRYSTKVTTKEAHDLFVRFSLDTEPIGYFPTLDRFFRGEIIIKKPWAGYVSKDRTVFKLRRTGAGIFKTNLSLLEIYGKLTQEKEEKILEIKIRLDWYVTLVLTLINVFVCIIILNFFNDASGWGILSAIVGLHFCSCFLT